MGLFCRYRTSDSWLNIAGRLPGSSSPKTKRTILPGHTTHTRDNEKQKLGFRSITGVSSHRDFLSMRVSRWVRPRKILDSLERHTPPS